MPKDLASLSGAPLDVITVTLLDELLNSMPSLLALRGQAVLCRSASQRCDAQEPAPDAGHGHFPVTIWPDLAAVNGGYGRPAPMHDLQVFGCLSCACA